MIAGSSRGAVTAIAFASLGALAVACAGAPPREPEAVVEISSTLPSAASSAAPIASSAAAPHASPEAAASADVVEDAGVVDEGTLAPAAQFGMIGILSVDGGSFGQGAFDADGGAIWGSGFGSGSVGSFGRLGHGGAPSPSLTPGDVAAKGALPPDIIQRIVRQSFSRYLLCYKKGLAKNSQLAGRIVVKFVIGKDGAVSSASDGGSDLRDKDVVSCVVRAFVSLGFPAPDGGTVAVSYPLRFSPDADDTKKKP